MATDERCGQDDRQAENKPAQIVKRSGGAVRQNESHDERYRGRGHKRELPNGSAGHARQATMVRPWRRSIEIGRTSSVPNVCTRITTENHRDPESLLRQVEAAERALHRGQL